MVKLAKNTSIISKLLDTSNFAQVSYHSSLQGIKFITPTDCVGPASSKSALIGIMEAINDNGVNMIGLYEMLGVGKTTLAKEVGKHAREQKLYDKIVMFTVSQNPNINKIQDKVADFFGLKFETSSQEGKAEALFRSMQGVNKILVIVDDLWEEFKLESIRIPFGDGHKGSKEVDGECKGLPPVLDTVARALKDESLDAWRALKQRFKDSRHLVNEEVLGDVFKGLKLSYAYLKEGNNQITENDIQKIRIDIQIGVGLFPNVYSIEDKSKEIGMALKILQKSSLLLETYDAKTIRMHGVVRDFAHRLTSTGENRFMVKDEVKEWPHLDESFGCYTAIALWNCSSNIKNIPDNFVFSRGVG
ncbi:hypothetical protein GOBAR_DD18246 [Gossypium barbadense]|nr:hypothetical protein GOBAR_DD18246 [Gossypium barbadense]